ncbi:MAG TPA: 1,4-alpha-glucan branching protein GlgB [Rhodothermales bacterium]|nr:1,4-alpha-glucan branching protein GlgB [Rhodothermales bacterium]
MAWITQEDLEKWQSGTHSRSYEKLGAHPVQDDTCFALWAPHAESVSVVGDFNGWDPSACCMEGVGAGLWEALARGVGPGTHYKYRIQRGAYSVDKADPYAFALESPIAAGSAVAGMASIVTDLRFDWGDHKWMSTRKGPTGLNEPMAIYEVHLGSWMHKAAGESYTYREIAEPLADHVQKMGFSHVEFLPVMEHPYYGSWGYQVVGYYAPTFRFGTPHDLMYLIDYLHGKGIGVFLDWVPAHFATDPQGLVFYDGSTLFEYDDPNMRYHPDWGTYVFDYNKPGVKNFLVSNAIFWMDRYHIDGLRFDAVASMLYRDYSRGNWTPNMFGGRENLEALDLLKQINEAAFTEFPEINMIAEESTAWPGVSQPTYNGGLGFLYKWNMGWMHDTLLYMSKDPIHRKYHHNDLTFPFIYMFAEHYVLPLSHDEVVHGKGSLWGKMPGDDWQKAANLRLLYGHLVGHPGKKLLFMGCEFGQTSEWNHNHSIDWHLLEDPIHHGVMVWLQDLLHLYRTHPVFQLDGPDSFEGINFDDRDQSVISYMRKNGEKNLIFAFNFTPVPRYNYRVGVPKEGWYREVLNSDGLRYGGSNVGNFGQIESTPVQFHGRPVSLVVTLPPLGMLILEHEEPAEPVAATTTTAARRRG